MGDKAENKDESINHILVSRTDAIGDVILTLPLVGLLKSHYPKSHIIFLGKSYTKEILVRCKNIDHFMDWTEVSKKSRSEKIELFKDLKIDLAIHVFPNKEIAQLLKKAQVPHRVGTSQRLYHWWTCNHRPKVSRKNSDLHEALLNIELVTQSGFLPKADLGDDKSFYDKSSNDESSYKKSLAQYYNLQVEPYWPKTLYELKKDTRKKVILHVGSHKSARNWPVQRFLELAKILSSKDHLVFLTGTQEEGDFFRGQFLALKSPSIIDLTGQMGLGELFGFIKSCQGLVAASTGPLHMAASLGVPAVGIYPPMRPMHAGRWGPIGVKTKALSRLEKPECFDCLKLPEHCPCMESVTGQDVFEPLTELLNE